MTVRTIENSSYTAQPWGAERVVSEVSLGQRAFLFAHELFTTAQVLNLGLAIDMRGNLDEAALRRSLDALIVRHPLLRTTFETVGADVAAYIAPISQQPLKVLDLRDLTQEQRDQRRTQIEYQEMAHRFDLTRAPLMRATLIRLSASENLLILVNHHATSDGTSFFKIYMDELAELYSAFSAGRTDSLEPLTATFDDYIKWEKTCNSGNELAHGVEFWLSHLDGAPPYVDMPTNRPRPAAPSGRGNRVQGHPYKSLMDRVNAFARENSVSRVSVLLTAFYILLHRYSGQRDLVVGVPVANRAKPEFAALFGPLMNTLPIRAQICADVSFKHFVNDVEKTKKLAFNQMQIAFEKIVESSGRMRDTSRSAIHQIVFNFMNFSPDACQLKGLETHVSRLAGDGSLLDLMVDVEERGSDLAVAINYNTDIFDHAAVSRMIEHYYQLLNSGLASPQTSVETLQLLTVAEINELDDWNQTKSDFPEKLCLHKLLEKSASEHADEIAVISGSTRLTYAELDRRAACLAARLRTIGVDRNVLVGLYTGRGENMVVGVLGILKAGGAYVPLDQHFPADRLDYMVEDSGLIAIVTQSDLAEHVPGKGIPVVLVDDPGAQHDSANPPVEPASSDSSQLAYVIYTSGSTGRPKGVEVTHRSVVNFLCGMAREPGLSAEDTVLALTTLSFDISVLELFLPLIVGGRVVLIDRDVAMDGSRLASIIQDAGITCMQATPATYRILLESGWTGKTGLKALVGGEALPREIVSPLVRGCAEVWNMYGPTETTVWSTSHHINDLDAPIVIGRPIANTTVYVLDDRLQRVPVGVAGELYIGGEGLALGYHARPELTAERFVANPFIPGTRMYRTGDLARFHEDGTLECLGRIDNQVKVRGYRIELGEIESLISELDLVDQVVVTLMDIGQGGSELVCYYVADEEIPSEHFRSGLQKTLPAYMIPQRYVRLEQMPLTPNAKIDRKALPRPEREHQFTAKSGEGPRNDLEVRLAELWADVLEINPPGVDDDFFDLGGHSLSAVVLHRRINNELSKDLDLGMLFKYPTIRQLASAMGDRHRPEQRNVVALAKGRAPVPLFLLAGIHLYLTLARSLDNQTTYGVFLQDEVSWDEQRMSALRSADAARMAREYLTAIREVQPTGPYALGGACFGGVLAFEVARLLEQEGEEVMYLLLMETVLRSARTWLLKNWISAHWRQLKGRGIGYLFDRVLSRVGSLGSRVFDRDRPASKIIGADEEAANFARARSARFMHAVTSFSPSSSINPRQTVIIRAKDEQIFAGYLVDALGGMGDYISGPIEFSVFAGDHLGILRDPNVKQLASRIGLSLARINREVAEGRKS